MRVFFEVSMDLPSDGTKAEVGEYILTALTAERGCRHPQDPMFRMDPKSISVKGLKVPAKITA